MKRKTLLVIGDSVDFDSFKKLNKEKRFITSQGFEYVAMDYKTLFRTSRLDVATSKVLVITFFPFQYWDKHIERKKYKGLYGNLSFLKKFRKFCDKLVAKVEDLLEGHQIEFINDPRATAFYRDKAVVMKKLSKAGVKVPPRVRARTVATMHGLLQKGKRIYIKPRCGSMGKGISYLEQDRWQTNFKVRGGKIIQRCSDYGWRFKDVTGNGRFLQSLLRGDFIMEEAIPAFCIKDKKIDLRVYACLDRVMYIYPRKNSQDAVTTNISQGGKGSPALLKKIPPKVVDKIIRQVRKTMRALDLELAGVDVILDQGLKNAYVIDVNMFPGFPKRRTYNLARDIVRQLKKK